MKILNLYAGIGGNRKLWGNDHKIDAVEYDENIALVYKYHFLNDNVFIEDAHEFLKKHYMEYDFIWSSPPCPSHSRMRMNHKVKIYPDMSLYQEIIFLQKFFKGKWVVENVIPYYEPLIKPTKIIHRHCIWSNFEIPDKDFETLGTCKVAKEREFLQEKLGFNLDDYTGIDKRKVLRNCVVPELGLHIINQLNKE